MITEEEQGWLAMLHREDEKAMQLISSACYEGLVNIAFNFTELEDVAKKLTNQVLVDFWKERKKLNIQLGLKKYLKDKLVAECVTWLRYKYKLVYPVQVPAKSNVPEITKINFDFEEDNRKLIGKIVAAMPEKNKLVMRLSRHETYKINEIAIRLKTTNEVVEFYLLQSLDIIRQGLVRFG